MRRWPQSPSISPGRRACRAKLRRASASSGLPAHQSSARKPPALPDAAQATPLRSTTVTSTPRRLRKYADAGADRAAAADHHPHQPLRGLFVVATQIPAPTATMPTSRGRPIGSLRISAARGDSGDRVDRHRARNARRRRVLQREHPQEERSRAAEDRKIPHRQELPRSEAVDDREAAAECREQDKRRSTDPHAGRHEAERARPGDDTAGTRRYRAPCTAWRRS